MRFPTAVLFPLIVTGACSNNAALLDIDVQQHRAGDVEVLREVMNVPKRLPMIATDDGSLYFSVPDTVFRSSITNPAEFIPIIVADTLCAMRSHCRTLFEELHIQSPDTLYLLPGRSEMYRWTPSSGLAEVDTPLADSTYFCHDFTANAGVRDIFQIGGELIAVASHGYVLSRSDNWALEYIGRSPRVSLCHGDYEDDLFAVGGAGRNAFAGGFHVVQLRPFVRWLDRPRESRGLITAIAEQDGMILFAVREPAHVLIYDGDRFYLQEFRERGIQTLENGRTQPDGTVLFWGRNGVVRVQNGRFQVIAFQGYQSILGAALRGTDLYAVGRLSNGRGMYSALACLLCLHCEYSTRSDMANLLIPMVNSRRAVTNSKRDVVAILVPLVCVA